ncbi:hypothetical protein D3C73_984950 [compost metagenome]
MADRDLAEADLARDLGQASLVIDEAPAVDQNDGHGAEARRMGRFQISPRLRLVQRTIDGAVGGQALVDLDHAVVKLIVQADVAREQLGPGLPADPQGVAEPGGDRQHGRLTLAL